MTSKAKEQYYGIWRINTWMVDRNGVVLYFPTADVAAGQVHYLIADRRATAKEVEVRPFTTEDKVDG